MLQFQSLLELDLRHAISTRVGGVSSGDFASLNLGFHVGDDAEAVATNRQNFGKLAGFDATRLVAMNQIHGSDVRVVGAEDAGRGAFDLESALPGCDALVTNVAELPLLVQVADCAPILLFEPHTRVLAVAHAGWRGALNGVAGATVRAMTEEFGAKPAEIRVGIGPCLSVQNLEVGEEVAQEVAQKNSSAVVRRAEWPKPHLDLRRLIADDLRASGVQHLEINSQCTRERCDLFFSHRGQNGRAGRFGIVAWTED